VEFGEDREGFGNCGGRGTELGETAVEAGHANVVGLRSGHESRPFWSGGWERNRLEADWHEGLGLALRTEREAGPFVEPLAIWRHGSSAVLVAARLTPPEWSGRLWSERIVLVVVAGGVGSGHGNLAFLVQMDR
jgi:hypothetical protein